MRLLEKDLVTQDASMKPGQRLSTGKVTCATAETFTMAIKLELN